MNFRKKRPLASDEIQLDFVPLIDILLVVLIFITATTTFSKIYEIPVQLPSASDLTITAESHLLAISQDGQYAINGRFISDGQHSLHEALRQIPDKDSLLIYADANARHATVVFALEAARDALFQKISFATQE